MRTRREAAALSGWVTCKQTVSRSRRRILSESNSRMLKQVWSAKQAAFLPYRCDRGLCRRREYSRGFHPADVERETVYHRTGGAGNAGGLTRHGRTEAG